MYIFLKIVHTPRFFVHGQMYNFEVDVQKLFGNSLKNHRKLYFVHKNTKIFPLRGQKMAKRVRKHCFLFWNGKISKNEPFFVHKFQTKKTLIQTQAECC